MYSHNIAIRVIYLGEYFSTKTALQICLGNFFQNTYSLILSLEIQI